MKKPLFTKGIQTAASLKKKIAKLTESDRFFAISEALFSLIQSEKAPVFLLPALLSVLQEINVDLKEPYRFSNFEFWLNHFSELPFEKNLEIRGKIMGKYLPRYTFQSFFPLGKKEETIFGSHIITGHTRPDPDALIASLLGWMDAFCCRVGSALHLWQLPGGAPDSHVTSLLENFLGQTPVSLFSRSSLTLRLFARDLVTREAVLFAPRNASLTHLHHNENALAIVAVDDSGAWLGDWTQHDVEPVSQLLALVKSFFRSLEILLLESLLSAFKKPHLKEKQVQALLSKIWATTLEKGGRLPLTEYQKGQLDLFFKKIFLVEKGLKTNLHDLISGLKQLNLKGFADFEKQLENWDKHALFNKTGELVSDRVPFFSFLEWFFQTLGTATEEIAQFLDRLDIALLVKKEVLGLSSPFLTLRSEPDFISQKMEKRDFLTVVIPDGGKGWLPVGVVFGDKLHRHSLGSVSLRDFCNREEVDISPYLSIVSVVDHHKATLSTETPPVALIGDVQSSNTLIAEVELEINEKARRIKQPYFLHPERAYFDAFFTLQAILDDTDLLTKVSYRDLYVVNRLLGEMASLDGKSLSFSLADLKGDSGFIEKARERLLASKELGVFLKEIAFLKKKRLEESLLEAEKGKGASLFGDTKIQNGAIYVSQVKLFPSISPQFFQRYSKIFQTWLNHVEDYEKKHSKVTLYILMISTLFGTEKGVKAKKLPQDEWWMWASNEEGAMGLMERFLVSFFTSQEGKGLKFELIGPETLKEKLDLIRWPFVAFSQKETVSQKRFSKTSGKAVERGNGKAREGWNVPKEGSLVILRFQAGSLNSRKIALSPYLPVT